MGCAVRTADGEPDQRQGQGSLLGVGEMGQIGPASARARPNAGGSKQPARPKATGGVDARAAYGEGRCGGPQPSGTTVSRP